MRCIGMLLLRALGGIWAQFQLRVRSVDERRKRRALEQGFRIWRVGLRGGKRLWREVQES